MFGRKIKFKFKRTDTYGCRYTSERSLSKKQIERLLEDLFRSNDKGFDIDKFETPRELKLYANMIEKLIAHIENRSPRYKSIDWAEDKFRLDEIFNDILKDLDGLESKNTYIKSTKVEDAVCISYRQYIENIFNIRVSKDSVDVRCQISPEGKFIKVLFVSNSSSYARSMYFEEKDFHEHNKIFNEMNDFIDSYKRTEMRR